MSGHSKWSKIHRQKEVADAKRGQLFTKLGRAIAVAVRAGGGVADPDVNFQLRLAIEKAREYNMPKTNIERAVQRGAGKGEGSELIEKTYEGYGPEGIAVLVEVATDNKQRTGQEIRNLFEKGGGNLGGPGSVSFQFESRGYLEIEKPKQARLPSPGGEATGGQAEEVLLKLIDLGAEDVEEGDDEIEIYVKPEQLEEMKQKIQQAGYKLKSWELAMEPKNLVEITDRQKAAKVLNFMEKLQDHDDVQKVFANFDVPDEVIAEIKT